jgi:DNA-binding transcriptional ArsR family regulator
MRSNAPALLPILRSRHLAEVLTVLLLHPDVEYTLSEMAGMLGLPLTTVHREVTRLSSAQLIRERRVGRSRLVSADLSSRYARPLAELVTLAFGPHFVVSEKFRPLDTTAVAIYGSWAARYEGVEGRPPNDVDVLVIGEVPRRDIYEAAERAEQRLGLPVNPVLCSQARWLAASDALIQQIRTAPLVWVIGERSRSGVDGMSDLPLRRGEGR